MVEFAISNEIFLGMMAIFIVPLVLYLNKIMNKLSNLLTCFETLQKDYVDHKNHSEREVEKLNSVSEKVSLHSLIIERIERDIDSLMSKKGSPV